MKLSQTELARYLGQGASPLPPEILQIAEDCERELLHGCSPRRLARRVQLAELELNSQTLAAHLTGCREVYLAALTLGPEADRLLRLWSAQNMGKAAIGQALCAVYMDECCDELARDLEAALPEGQYLLPAYSPGYGDFSLEHQGPLLQLLDAPRRLGLSLSRGGMLLPEKSVTALLGITTEKSKRCMARCALCGLPSCAFRKELPT